ncbi:MAG: type II toxin-antitoxin system VapC family toxin, partial [Magnetococcales bacterium]|nr:type II toxin-antitoxin system VapC family toxin [Magnetococcales bacterium]
MTVIVDASVAFKWFVTEKDSTTAVSLLHSGQPLYAPDLIVAEVCNAGWRVWQKGEITNEQLQIISLRIGEPFSKLAGLSQLAPRAIEIASLLKHPAYDCFYLALVEQENTSLVTADERLISRLTGTPWASLVVSLAQWTPTNDSS